MTFEEYRGSVDQETKEKEPPPPPTTITPPETKEKEPKTTTIPPETKEKEPITTTIPPETKEKKRKITILSKVINFIILSANTWGGRTSFLVMLLAFLYFVLGGPVKWETEAPAVAEPVQLPPWFHKWLDSQEAEMGEMSLKCEKVQGSVGWKIRCKDLRAENQNPEWLNLHISSEKPSKKGGDGESGLCCTTCTKPIPPPPGIFQRIKTIITEKTTVLLTFIRRFFSESPIEPPTPSCTYHSETQSTELEMELKRTIQLKLRELLQNEISKQTSKPCKEAAPSSIQRRLETSFQKILEAEIQELRPELVFEDSPHDPTHPPLTETQQSSVTQTITTTYTTDVLRESRV